MTEAEWLACQDPVDAQFLRRDKSKRKRRLWAVACCRRIDAYLTPGGRDALAVAEQFADGAADEPCLLEAYRKIGRARTDARKLAAEAVRHASYPPLMDWTIGAVDAAASVFREAGVLRADSRGYRSEAAVQADLARDIFGNPFRPVVLDPAWLTSTVTELARGIYEERAFDRLPILADAMQDAGCDNTDLLDHCRNDGPHVRGCWVVDLVLGKQ